MVVMASYLLFKQVPPLFYPFRLTLHVFQVKNGGWKSQIISTSAGVAALRAKGLSPTG